MSIIAAVRKNDRTFLAADTLTCFGDSHRVPQSNSCTPLCLACDGYDACVIALDVCAGRMSIDCADDT